MTIIQIILSVVAIRLALYVYRIINKQKFVLTDVQYLYYVDLFLFKFKIKRNPSKAGYKFEIFVRDMMREFGLEAEIGMTVKNNGGYPKELYASKGDCGIDVIVTAKNEIILIQTKLYSSALTKGIVAESNIVHDIFKEYYKSKGDHRPINFTIVTNNKLDNTARILANKVGIRYVEEHDLNDLMYRTSRVNKSKGFFRRVFA